MVSRLTDEDRRLRSITEAAWQSTVLDIARRNGWRTYHPPKAGVRANGSVRATTPGYPDLTIVRGPRLIFAELKRETGNTTEAQDGWLIDLTHAGAEVYVWRPRNLAEVRAVLGSP